MDILPDILSKLGHYIPLLVTIALAAIILWLADRLLLRRAKLTTESRLPGQLIMLGLTVLSFIAVILVLPVNETSRGELLSLMGLVLTGVIALSSTSFVSNAMAGLMLRSVKSFKHGDFVRVDEHFGRVTERGLFHTEIQTELRDLVTLPNLYLASNAVTVVRSSGTIISCDISLGYDVGHYQVEELLKAAASSSELQEPFVQILTLGDFSVSYRVAGYYPEVKHLLTMKTRLKQQVLDQLHGAGIEIVSPTFMNQRSVSDQRFAAQPKPEQDPSAFAKMHPSPEALIFDKADKAEKLHILEEEYKSLLAEIKQLQEGKTDAPKENVQHEVEMREQRLKLLDNVIVKAREKKHE